MKPILDVKISRKRFIEGMAAGAMAPLCGCIANLSPASGTWHDKPAENRQPLTSFGFITDCHYAAHLKPSLLRQYADGVQRVREFVVKMNDSGVDFVVEGGDFKDLGRTREESLAYLDAIERTFAEFKGPRYHVLGNHDHDNLSKSEFLAHIANAGQSNARAYYAFERSGIKFIVLDACYRKDGQPYDCGIFNWKETMIPPAQVKFLQAELATANGPCLIFVHQQLDAEDETRIVNAPEIREILERSGKVKAVVQGHFHEGSFREINGIGYYTMRASVIGEGSEANAFGIVDVFADGSIRVRGANSALSLGLTADGAWRAAHGWRPGHYQVHYIFTGRGESMLHIFPDGTSMLLDCGDSMRFYGTPQETPHLPDLTRRSGEWVARYVERVNPKGKNVDYFHLSHYHEDHGGGERYHGELIHADTGDYWRCGLADAARFLTFGKVVDRAWPSFDDPLNVLDTSRDGTPRNVRKVYAHLAKQGTKIERFRLGAKDQFVQQNREQAKKGFEVRNVCANGRFVRKNGEVVDLYRHLVESGAKSFNENGMSCGIVVRYGKFSLFSAGDFSDNRKGASGKSEQTEELLAEALGRVDVAKCNHHGHHSMFPKLVSALRARVWTACVLDQLHMTDDTMRRLSDRNLYGGNRAIIPTYMPQKRPSDGFGPTPLGDVPEAVLREPCHIVVDVPEGGATYTVSCFSAQDESRRLKAVLGFFSHSDQ